jgi:hypothetical protein
MTNFSAFRVLPSAFCLLAFLVAYFYFYAQGFPLFADTDVSWHIAAGDLIFSERALPAKDSWTFTGGEQSWYLISWLWDALLAAIKQVAGLAGVYVFSLAFAAFAVLLLVGNVEQRPAIGSDAKIFTMLLAVLCMYEFALARPQLAGYALILLTHRLLHRSRWKASLAWWLVPIMALWVNVHGTFIAGFTILGAYGLEALMLRDWPRLRHLVIVGLASVAALLVNPYGFEMYHAVMRTLDSSITQIIIEWMPFVFSNSLGLSLWLLMFVLVSNLRESTVPFADRILAIAWLVAMLLSMRNAAVFVLVSAPYMAINMQRFIDHLAAIRTRRGDPLQPLSKPFAQLFLALAAVALVTVSYLGIARLKGEEFLAHPSQDPAPAIHYAFKYHGDKKFLNDYGLGGRIIYETGGELPVFVDGRAGTAYPESVMDDYARFLRVEKGWQEMAARYGVQGIIAGNNLPFSQAYAAGQYHDRWTQVYRDEVAGVYLRK